jgi:1-acyl-sn-glycerol-3-phosphate acyltransferase
MPPPALRRPLTITTWLIVSLVGLLASPLLLGLGALVSAALRRPQPLLLARMLVAYFARELGVLTACGALWVLSGCGVCMRRTWSQRLHHRLLCWFVHGLSAKATELLSITVEPDPSPAAEAALARDRPLLFFSRHAGPGDTLLLLDLLMTRYQRLPSVVFKEALAIDPSVDLIGHRLPHAVLDNSDRDECEKRIEEIARGLEPRGVLVLFPEGGNFTPERRRQAIRKLRRKGRRREASVGEQMNNVLPPYPGGTLAALRGNPDAEVIFSAHTGLGRAAFPREIWKHPPIGRAFETAMWLSSPQEIPTDEKARSKWLYEWWKRLDDWVGSRAGGERDS